MKQQRTCTNNRWIPPLLGNTLLKQMGNVPFSFRPESLSVAGFKDIKCRSSNTSLQTDSEWVWKRIFPIPTRPLKGWAAFPAPYSWSSLPWPSSETSAPQLESKGLQQPLHLTHWVGQLEPRLLPHKFTIMPRSYVYPSTESPSNSTRINWSHQKPASSSPLLPSKWRFVVLSSHQPRLLPPNLLPIYHSRRHGGSGQLKSHCNQKTQVMAYLV